MIDFVQGSAIDAAHEQPKLSSLSITYTTIPVRKVDDGQFIALLQPVRQPVGGDVMDLGLHTWSWGDGHAAHGGM